MKISFKQIVLTTFIFLELLSVMAFAGMPKDVKIVNSEAFNSMKSKITITIILARRSDCEGFGICRITLSGSVGKVNSCNALISLDESNNGAIVLEIDKSKGITAEAYNKYFSKGTFLMEDDSPIPDDVLRELGIKGSRTMLAGNYRVTERNGLLVVSIPVK